MFGPPVKATVPRPLGDAIVDGFDFDFEIDDEKLDKKNIPAFIKKLRELTTFASTDSN
jgi:hypothetical protein